MPLESRRITGEAWSLKGKARPRIRITPRKKNVAIVLMSPHGVKRATHHTGRSNFVGSEEGTRGKWLKKEKGRNGLTRTGEKSSSAYLTSIVETLFLSGDEGETLKRHKSFLPFKCLSFLVLWRAENSAHTDGVGFKAWNFWGREKNEIDRSIRRKVGKMYEKWYKKYQESHKKSRTGSV